MNEDQQRDKQLNEHLNSLEEDEDMALSNCCEAVICQDSDICCECKEHCVTKAEQAEIERDGYYDSLYEEQRDKKDGMND